MSFFSFDSRIYSFIENEKSDKRKGIDDFIPLKTE